MIGKRNIDGTSTRGVLLSMATAILLTGCGPHHSNGSAAPAPVGTTVVITGTAATATALAHQPIAARCAAGNGTATTDANGAFSVTVNSATLPCVLQAGGGADALYSFALGSGTALTANVSPLTHLLVAQAAAVDPAAYYAAFDTTAALALTAAAVAAAQARLQSLLTAAGIQADTFGDWLTAALVLRAGTTAGNAYAQALEALLAALATGGTTLPAFTTVVVEQAPVATAPSSTASLPAALLLRPAAATCAALRSGRYRVITPTPGATFSSQAGIATIDAATLAITRGDGTAGVWSANGACRFNDNGNGWVGDIVVSQAGVWAGRYSLDGGATFRSLIAVPEQSHTVAELAATWRQMGMGTASSGFSAFTGTTTLDVTGVFTAGTQCRNDTTWAVDACTTLTPQLLGLLTPITANADGGFDLGDTLTQTTTTRMFGYRAGGGYLMLVSVSNGGGFSIWTPHLAMPLAAVGTTAFNVNFNITGNLTVIGTEYTTNTVTSQDLAAGSWTRTQQNVGLPFSYVTTLFANRPAQGLFFRPAGTVLASDGTTTVRLNEFTAMRTFGMGFSPLVIPAPHTFQMSVGVPAP